MKNIIWLTSYPKSGNTWFRIIITNLLGEKEETDLNALEFTPISSSRHIVSNCAGIDTGYLTHDENDLLRHDSNNWFAKNAEKIIFRKCHDAYTFLDDGRPLAGNPELYKTIYIIRNPLSVVSSLANHNSCSIDKAIEIMNNENHTLSNKTKKYDSQLRQKVLCWSGHVLSWIEHKNLELITMKYEALHIKPLEVLREAFYFAGLNNTDTEIIEAIEKSKFEKLSKKEDEKGFR